jgi:hypothetical protein
MYLPNLGQSAEPHEFATVHGIENCKPRITDGVSGQNGSQQ